MVLSFACAIYREEKTQPSNQRSLTIVHSTWVWFMQTERTAPRTARPFCDTSTTLRIETFFHTNVNFLVPDYQLIELSNDKLWFCGILLILQRLEVVIHVWRYIWPKWCRIHPVFMSYIHGILLNWNIPSFEQCQINSLSFWPGHCLWWEQFSFWDLPEFQRLAKCSQFAQYG